MNKIPYTIAGCPETSLGGMFLIHLNARDSQQALAVVDACFKSRHVNCVVTLGHNLTPCPTQTVETPEQFVELVKKTLKIIEVENPLKPHLSVYYKEKVVALKDYLDWVKS